MADDQAITDDVVVPLRPEQSRPKDPTGAERQSRWRENKRNGRRKDKQNKKKRGNGERTVTPVPLLADAPPLAAAVTQAPPSDGVTTSREILPNLAPPRTVERAPRYASIPLVIVAYGFFALGVSINIWNAMTGGPIANMILPAAMGVLAESLMFFLPERTLSLRWISRLFTWAFLAFVVAFALTNSLRMASIVSADQAAARADRQTEGVRTAGQALEVARAKRDEACGRGLGKTVACQSRQAEVTKLEAKQTQAAHNVAAQAKPESTDFAKLVAWVSNGALHPGSEDFDMLWLLFRTLLPQVGGLVLMLARR